MFGKTTETEATEATDYATLARRYADAAAAITGGPTGLNPKAVALAGMAQAFATVAIMEQGADRA